MDMKKILVAIIIIGVLVSTAPLGLGGEETIQTTLNNSYEPIIQGSNDYFKSTYREPLEDLIENPGSLPGGEPEFIPGEFIIKFREDVDIDLALSPDGFLMTNIASIDVLNRNYGVIAAEKIFEHDPLPPLVNIYKFILTDGTDILRIAERYENDPDVVYAEPNYVYYTCFVPDDPNFDLQWGLHNIGQAKGFLDADIDAPEAWDIETGSADVIIAIADSGVDYTHVDLAGNIWVNNGEIPGNGVDDDGNGFIDDVHGWDFADDNNDPMDSFWHGTHCAGIAGAVGNNGVGIAGVAWNCKVMPVRIGSHIIIEDAAANGITYAADNGADVISMSWGGRSTSQLIEDALNYAHDQGVVLVAAAGNYNTDIILFPADNEHVISVAALNTDDFKAYFSNYGSEVDVAAPGQDIYSTMPNNDYGLKSGTSMACPHVSGLAALLLSKDPGLSPLMVQAIITSTTDRLPPTEKIERGRMNAFKALLRGPGPTTAIIEDPSHSVDVNGYIEITGMAYGEGFQYYTLNYALGRHPSAGDWIELVNSTTPVQEGILATLDTTSLEEGLYTLCLTVVCDNGIYQDVLWIVVNNEVNTVYVDDDGGSGIDYTSIREAVYGTGVGDTLNVHTGIYYERVKIWKSITLKGEHSESTIIDSQGIGFVLHLYADGVNISGFTIQNSSNLYADIGIYLGSDGNTVRENVLIENSFAIGLGDSCDNTIVENTIRDNVWGIVLIFSTGNYIADNTLTNNYRSISVDESSNTNIIINNTLIDSGLSGILIYGSFDNLISDNVFTNQHIGIEMDKTSSTNITGNIITNTVREGISLIDSNTNTIYGNTLENAEIGVNLYRSSNNNILRNNFFNSKDKDAFFIGDEISHGKNKWQRNYWNQFRILPKLIFGKIDLWFIRIPWLNIDWHPAKEPYDNSSI